MKRKTLIMGLLTAMTIGLAAAACASDTCVYGPFDGNPNNITVQEGRDGSYYAAKLRILCKILDSDRRDLRVLPGYQALDGKNGQEQARILVRYSHTVVLYDFVSVKKPGRHASESERNAYEVHKLVRRLAKKYDMQCGDTLHYFLWHDQEITYNPWIQRWEFRENGDRYEIYNGHVYSKEGY